MDWYLDSGDTEALRALRHEIVAYLARHAEPDADLDAAALVVSELLANAFHHAAGPTWVSVDWPGRRPTIVVRDLGRGFHIDDLSTVSAPDAAASSGRGLFIVSRLTDELSAASRRAGGSEVRVQLDVDRTPQLDHNPPRRRTSVLPSMEEVQPDGGFGRESFLRALVVQLSQAVEEQQGPDAADAAVAQVGTDVGGRMEEEYRLARDVVGRMTPEQMADCFVRLKHAVDGDFYVIELTEDRIVLGNSRCPFGEVVRRAPSLCRMTSSVFGGIAARNTENGAAVALEERIALGDPGCRVVVYLGPAPAAATGTAHSYQPPVS